MVQRAEEHGTAMKLLQEELHELREARTRDKEREAMRMQESEMELQILRDRCECLEEKHRNGAGQVWFCFRIFKELSTDRLKGRQGTDGTAPF